MKWFRFKINSKKYRREIYRFFTFQQESDYCTMITNVTAYKQIDILGNFTVIKIETYMPGLIIGKRGELIDRLTKFIENEVGHQVKIKLEECKLWTKLWR